MTTVGLMDNLAEFLRPAVTDYSTQQPSGQREIKVYAGFPPAGIVYLCSCHRSA